MEPQYIKNVFHEGKKYLTCVIKNVTTIQQKKQNSTSQTKDSNTSKRIVEKLHVSHLQSRISAGGYI